MIDWTDPAARLRLIEKVGPDEYNRLLNTYFDENPIRPVPSRFGTLFAVGRTGRAFSTRKDAEEFLARGAK